ncbi:MAG: sigma-54 dependent transcriptional regulator [Gammaproteobacteria bacterium]|nr:sigma-54 dependent transcriptional regulator [Gammaproteobacteria bacterium]MBU1655207.1 sigma-54 dependent transcriptional regulator [Gammaproteobacteria bacterium]MBU1959928.1 sigma-54 dependent transcriptional regulator [Gammaproteobacteria bacterium]
MSRPLALIVDDEPDIRELLEITLGRMEIDTIGAADLASARRHLTAGNRFDLCLTDMRLPDGSGLQLVEENGTKLPIAVITAHGSMETAIQALKAGAFDFVSKPIDLGILRRLVQTALRLSRTQERGQPPSNGLPRPSARLLGDSASIRDIRVMIGKLARSQAPVHISGESGTGKELVARLIHEQGPRHGHPFIAINCGAVPSELMESEFFGHRKGSFTGAIADKEGLFQAAEGGTLFLDEVADLPLHMQVKLLRSIQEKSVRPVGGQQEIPVDVRILSATHKDLAQLVQEGLFRQDLFYRLNVIGLEMPPLRKRHEDIPALLDFLLARVAAHNGLDKPAIAPEAIRRLEAYPFPGNVRELENILERAVALCEAGIIQAEELCLPAVDGLTLAEAEERSEGVGLEEYLEQIERRLLLETLEATRWNRTAAAKKLGISFRALRYRLEKLDLDQRQE